MGLFTPYKRHANPFTYVPRFFDPEKERREQRRRELTGCTSEDTEENYTPGKYIRSVREAREEKGVRKGGTPKMMILAAVVLLAMCVYMLYPRIVAAFSKAHRSVVQEQLDEYKEFDPYAPITIVPNDYKEE